MSVHPGPVGSASLQVKDMITSGAVLRRLCLSGGSRDHLCDQSGNRDDTGRNAGSRCPFAQEPTSDRLVKTRFRRDTSCRADPSQRRTQLCVFGFGFGFGEPTFRARRPAVAVVA